MMVVNGNANDINFSAITDPSKQAEIYRYLETLKKDEDGWRRSVQTITSGSLSNTEEHFLLLQVIEDFLQRRYETAPASDAQILRGLLFHWIKFMLEDGQQKPVFILNKMAHVYALVFAVDFPMKWPNFFDDLFFSANVLEKRLALFYLKVLLAIDSEVVDRDIQRSKEESDRNVKIKDGMREICIQKIAQSWSSILGTVDDDTVQCLALDSIAAYVDWIDVDLVANDTVMSIVIDRLARASTSESAVNAVCGLLHKGMPPERKAALVLTLMTVFRSNNLLAVDDSSDEDQVLRVGSLVNTLGLVLLEVFGKLNACDLLEAEQQRCLEELNGLVEVALLVLNNESPELSELSLDIIKAYLSFLFKRGNITDSLMQKVISVCLSRYVMGDDLEVDGDGEDEVDFGEYRKDLRSLLNVIGSKRPEMIVGALEPWVLETTTSGCQMPVKRVEALLQLIYSLHEIIPSNLLQAPREGIAERASRLPLLILEGITLDGRSSSVHVMYFELACRYERLLALRPQPAVRLVAAAFLDERGIAIPIGNVRTRIVYLFCRFVKAHKIVLSPLVSEVITRLAPLLAVSPEVGSSFLSSDDQAYLFEATATLIVFGDLTTELKTTYFNELASTLAQKFESTASELNAQRARNADREEQEKNQQFMSNIVVYCSRMSKAFNNAQSMQSCNCVDIYLRLLKLFISNLNAPNAFLLESVRQFAHRLIVCLEAELLPFIAELFEKLAEVSNDMDSMHHLLIFCHQAVAKYKKSILTSGVNLGQVLTIAARFSMQEQESSVAAKDDSQRALIYVQRAFLQLLYSVIISDCVDAISNEGLLDILLEAATRLALSTDITSQKLALSSLTRVAQHSPIWSQRTLRTALELPALPHITPSDAGSTIVVHEVCNTLTTLYEADSAGFAQAVRGLLPVQFGEKLLSALTNLKGKSLDKEIMSMYAQLRIQQNQS